MKKLSWILFSIFISANAGAQEDFDTELNQANDINSSIESSVPSSSTDSPYDSPEPSYNATAEPALDSVTSEPAPAYNKPTAPKKGGSIMVPHPNAAKGLIRINKDRSYQYRTPEIGKNQAMSVRVGSVSPPKVTGPGGITYGDIYGAADMVGVLADYEWQPFRGFGAMGLQLGAGIMISRGNGRFADRSIAQETYDLFVVPLSAFLVYRFEYMRRQWFVPYAIGGGTLYGLYEKRDDSKPAQMASSPTAGFGGGIHFSISRWDAQGAFVMQHEYGVADLWLTAELRVLQGLRSDIDFTNRTASLGITVDY